MHHSPQPSKTNTQDLDSSRDSPHTDAMRYTPPLLQSAIEVALAAGNILRGAWGTDVRAEHKSPGDLVSEIDRELDSFIAAALRRLTPTARIVSEESWDNEPLDTKTTWVVDPLDGSTAFLRTKDPSHPSILIALVEEGEVTCSVVYFPLINELYSAARGNGAWRNGERISWNSQTQPLTWLRLNHYGDASLESSFVQTLRENSRRPRGVDLVSTEPPSAGLACRLQPGMALVHDNNVLARKQGCWDIAAPLLWVREAGGVMCTPSGCPVSLNEEGPIVVATSKEIAELVQHLGSPSSRLLPFRLRKATPEEGPSLARFILEHGKSEWNHLPEDELMLHGHEIEAGKAHAVVAELHGGIVGVATYQIGAFYLDLDRPLAPQEQRAYVSEVTVTRSFRGLGVGSKLLGCLVGALSSSGVKKIYAKRHEDNAGSAGMMRKAGFLPLASFPDPEIRTTGSRRTTVERCAPKI